MRKRVSSFLRLQFAVVIFFLFWPTRTNSENLRVETCPGSKALLPCPILTPTESDDRSLAAFWYKDDQVAPFYMVDGRSSASIDQGIHRRLSSLGNRSTFDVTSTPAMLHVSVENKEDAGVYVCRVDFYKSNPKPSVVELVVLPPTPKLIIYEGGSVLPGVAGPYNEGSDLELTCELTGVESGPMQVLWMIKGIVIDSTFKVLPNGRRRNDYLIRSLERDLWMVNITCIAAKHLNSTTNPFLTASVKLDLYLKPLGTRITPSHGICREGSILELRCQSWGSRPPSEITWWMKNFRLFNVSGYKYDLDSTASTLTLLPTAADNGKTIRCQAQNHKLLGAIHEDSVILNVTFPPKVSLSLKTYSTGSLSEGDTVALMCKVTANPPVGLTHWSFVQETTVKSNQDPFPSQGRPTLVLERLEAWHKGSYRCRVNNSEGSGESNALWLAVRHRPICKADQQVSYGAYFGETLNIQCEVEAEPVTVSFHWGFANTLVQHDNINFSSRGLKSIAIYRPLEDIHLGSLFCWANNTVGEQHVPCTFTVFKPVVPNRPKNCKALNRTHTWFLVTCEAGYDGGAPQHFHFQARIKGSGESGIALHSPIPVFSLSGLPPGTNFEVIITSKNKMGESANFYLDVSTVRSSKKGLSTWRASRNLLLSSMLILFFAVLTLATAAILRHRSRPFLLIIH